MLCFSAHGHFELSLEGCIVHCHYSDGFNQAGIQELANAVLSIASSLERWVLFQHPDPSAGITNDAIETMMDSYLAFQQAGCLAAAVVENSPFVYAGKGRQPEALTMPIKIHKDSELLLNWLRSVIHQ